MSMYINHEDSFFFSSNDDPTTLGPALNKDLNGSRFQVRMEPPISVPTDAQSVTIECVNANILHVTPNIAAEYGNNTMYVEYDYDDGGPQTFGMTLVLLHLECTITSNVSSFPFISTSSLLTLHPPRLPMTEPSHAQVSSTHPPSFSSS